MHKPNGNKWKRYILIGVVLARLRRLFSNGLYNRTGRGISPVFVSGLPATMNSCLTMKKA